MSKQFAALSGLLAAAVTLAQAIIGPGIHGQVLFQAWLNLVIYSLAGFVLGAAAERLLSDAWQVMAKEQLARLEETEQQSQDQQEE